MRRTTFGRSLRRSLKPIPIRSFAGRAGTFPGGSAGTEMGFGGHRRTAGWSLNGPIWGGDHGKPHRRWSVWARPDFSASLRSVRHAGCSTHGNAVSAASFPDDESHETQTAAARASTRNEAKSELHRAPAWPRRPRPFGHARGILMTEIWSRARTLPHARLRPFRLGTRR